MRRLLVLAACLVAAAPTAAGAYGQQTWPNARPAAEEDDPQQSGQNLSTPTQQGRTATSSVGQVGQRQTREEAAKSIAPMGRISSRIQNRVQSRIRNRIDRNYDPLANARTPFAAAEEQTRTPGGRKR
jgi:hypothetical protein